MILFIQCLICCLLFTLLILPAQYKDPIKMIMSYPPKIRQRVEELPQYKGAIKQKEKKHIATKIFGIVLFIFVLTLIAYLSGCKDYFFHVKGAFIGIIFGLFVALSSGCIIHLILKI